MATTILEISRNKKQDKAKNTFYRKQYKFGDLRVYEPGISILQEAKQFLISSSIYKRIDPKYHRRPDLLSFHEYKSVEFWYVLLYINDIQSIIDFTPDYAYIPSTAALHNFMKDYIPDNQKTETLEEFNEIQDAKPLILKRV